MAMPAENTSSSTRRIYQSLSKNKPFERRLYATAPEGDDRYFYKTPDVEAVITKFETFVNDDLAVRGKRLLGIVANRGDGKTTLLGFLKHLQNEPFLPVQVDAAGRDLEPPFVVAKLIQFLLYELKRRAEIEEKVYNQANLDFRAALTAENMSRWAETQMRLISPLLVGRYVVWLCDNVEDRRWLQGFQQLLILRDQEPPEASFFEDTAVLVVFTTSEPKLREAWGDPTVRAGGSELVPIRVGKDDMFNIVTKILAAACTDLPDELRPEAERLLKSNPVFPIDAEALSLYLAAKARPVPVESARNEVAVTVSEIQLRNTLRLLQRLLDASAETNCDDVIELEVIWKRDLGLKDNRAT